MEILAALDGALEAQERADWHCMLIGVSRAVQCWRKKVCQTVEGPLYELELREVNGGWRAAVLWPWIRMFAKGERLSPRRAARTSAKRAAAQGLLSTLVRACEAVQVPSGARRVAVHV